jgi:hypothetical protein
VEHEQAWLASTVRRIEPRAGWYSAPITFDATALASEDAHPHGRTPAGEEPPRRRGALALLDRWVDPLSIRCVVSSERPSDPGRAVVAQPRPFDVRVTVRAGGAASRRTEPCGHLSVLAAASSAHTLANSLRRRGVVTQASAQHPARRPRYIVYTVCTVWHFVCLPSNAYSSDRSGRGLVPFLVPGAPAPTDCVLTPFYFLL